MDNHPFLMDKSTISEGWGLSSLTKLVNITIITIVYVQILIIGV